MIILIKIIGKIPELSIVPKRYVVMVRKLFTTMYLQLQNF